MQEKDDKEKGTDSSESPEQTSETGQQTKPKTPPSRGRTFGTTGAEKRG